MSAYSLTPATGADGKRNATSSCACTTRRMAWLRDTQSTPLHRSSASLTKSYVASARTPAHRSRRASPLVWASVLSPRPSLPRFELQLTIADDVAGRVDDDHRRGFSRRQAEALVED